ncbi:MAG: ComEC/Rec2 family competence protein [Hyphomicrobiales bacterium]|nr:ComEC/Rec2 family competence protein [Hyphomicrobiales bacterium]MDE2114518.1 ComEC family competence protein [Hyphomicrobiales bacterium]
MGKVPLQASTMRGVGGQQELAGKRCEAYPGRRVLSWLIATGRAAIARGRSDFLLEMEDRRLALWLPVVAGLGVLLYFSADREPASGYAALICACFALLAFLTINHRPASTSFFVISVLALGFASAQWRAHSVRAPILGHITVDNLTGFVEQVDLRPNGARFVLKLESAEKLPVAATPRRVRLTMRTRPEFAAGDFIAVKARLLPPSHAVLPGGYDFARDAYFMGIGAVGSVLGRAERFSPPLPASLRLRFMAAIDQTRNRLAMRVNQVIGGAPGTIAAAMVTGKRDLLSQSTRELIREAGIFHIITISGIQMSLVAGILFWFIRRLLALSTTLALSYPIKKWAAGAAMVFACLYDIGTGSRVGTERALVMTLVVFLAIIMDRAALTMRNLAIAAWAVILLEPDAILGASFQLSFAAVAALVAVYETGQRRLARQVEWPQAIGRDGRQKMHQPLKAPWLSSLREGIRHFFSSRLAAILLSTMAATSATAPFMAYDFHELSLYVMIGNPLTLGIIELFAIPGALLGAVLYPLGLDAPVWHYLGLGISLVLWVARHIAAAPGASLPIPEFSATALSFLTLGLLSAVIWRSPVWRATAIPLVLIGAAMVPLRAKFDVLIPASGDYLAFRGRDGHLAFLGKRKNNFALEQWLRADGDSRQPESLIPVNDPQAGCGALGCTAKLSPGRSIALVLKSEAFSEDCARATIVVTPLFAPSSCAALTFDHAFLAASGASTLEFAGDRIIQTSSRTFAQDRLWSPKAPRWALAKFTPEAPPPAPSADMRPFQP